MGAFVLGVAASLVTFDAPRHWEIPAGQLCLPAHDQDELRRRAEALEAHVKRVQAMLAREKPQQRGRARSVLCLTMLDRHGNPMRFPTTTAAGAAVNQRATRVHSAIERNGTAGGHRFAWADRHDRPAA